MSAALNPSVHPTPCQTATQDINHKNTKRAESSSESGNSSTPALMLTLNFMLKGSKCVI